MHKLTAKIRESRARRRKHWRVLRSSQAHTDDLLKGLKSARREIERLERVIERRRKRGADADKIERTADRLEAERGAKDQILERLDARLTKNQRIKDALAKDNKRVRELRAKRRKIQTQQANSIGKYWNMAEFDCNDGTDVPDYMEDDLDALAVRVLDKLRDKFGPGHVNSGYRTVSWNAAIGGEPNSYHIYTIRQSQPAADLTFAGGSPSQWAAYARSLGVGGVGQYASFVHVDTGPRRDWWG